MSFAAGIGAGIGCGIACGIPAGRSAARKEFAAKLGDLASTGQIRITDGAGREITVEGLLDDALPAQGTASPRLALVAVGLGLLALGGLLAFYMMST